MKELKERSYIGIVHIQINNEMKNPGRRLTSEEIWSLQTVNYKNKREYTVTPVLTSSLSAHNKSLQIEIVPKMIPETNITDVYPTLQYSSSGVQNKNQFIVSDPNDTFVYYLFRFQNPYTSIMKIKRNKKLWGVSIIVPSFIRFGCCAGNFLLGCSDRTIYCFNIDDGARSLPIFIGNHIIYLDSIHIDSFEHYVACASEIGILWIWKTTNNMLQLTYLLNFKDPFPVIKSISMTIETSASRSSQYS